MKKILVISLIGLMACFAVGCRLFDGGDDDEGGSSPAVASNVVVQAKVPTGVLAQNILPALIPTDIQVSMNGVPLTYSSTVGGFMIFSNTFSVTDASFSVLLSAGGGQAALTVQVGTMAPVTMTVTLDTTTTGSKTKSFSLTITISAPATDGTYTVQVSGDSGFSGPVNPVISAKSLGVTGIDYRTTAGTFLPLANATGVPSISPTIRVTFDSVVDKATQNFQITAKSSGGNQVTLTQNDLGTVFTVNQTDVPAGTKPAYSYLDVTLLVTSTQGRFFKPGVTYTMTFESASVSRKDDPSVRLRPILFFQRTFTTAPAI